MPAFAGSDPPFNYMDLTTVFVVSLLPLERQGDVT